MATAAAVMLAGIAMNVAFAQTDLPSITQNRSTLDSKLDQQFQTMDANHDGRVSKSGFDAYWEHRIQRSDTNHDGRISQEEARAAAKQANGGKLPDKNRFDRRWNEVSHHGLLERSQVLAWHQRFFRQADADGNGYLDKTEMRKSLAANNLNVGLL